MWTWVVYGNAHFTKTGNFSMFSLVKLCACLYLVCDVLDKYLIGFSILQ